MNGISYLLDTNVVIGLLKAFPDALNLTKTHPDLLERCAVSQITRMELLGFPELDTESQQEIQAFLENCPVILLDEQIEISAIALRRSGRFKLPDAIIAATAQVHHLTLLTLDDRLAKAVAAYSVN